MKNFVCFICLFFFCASSLFSQSKKALQAQRKMFAEIKAKPLYVVTDVVDKKYEAKLAEKSDKTEYNNYLSLINSFNNTLRSAVTEYLTFFPSVKYITRDELKDMKEKELKKVNVLMRRLPQKVTTTMGIGMGANGTGQYTRWSDIKLESLKLDTTNMEDNLALDFNSDINDFIASIRSQNFSRLFNSGGEIYYAVRQIAYMLNNQQPTSGIEVANKIMEQMKTRTLLISKKDLSLSLTEDEIKAEYPHQFKIVSEAEFDAELKGKNKDFLLLVCIPYPAGQYTDVGLTHTIYDPTTEEVFTPNVPKCKGPIEKKHFKYYTSIQK